MTCYTLYTYVCICMCNDRSIYFVFLKPVSIKMAFNLVGRAEFLLILLLIQFTCSQEYKIPNVRIQALKPKGFRASIEDAPNLALFTFQGNVNKDIGSTDVGTISGEVLTPTGGRWVVEDPNIELKVGDVIKYHVFVAVNSNGYVADNLTYIVTELEDPFRPALPLNVGGECRPTLTKVRGARACGGQTIFEDNFDNLRENVWQIEQYIPVFHPEHPFVTYQRLEEQPTVTTSNGFLRIRPTLQQNLRGFNNESIYSGTLNLFSGCTAPAEACIFTASGADILPPIVSGRITSKSFAFTYGTVHVRAKLPQGDWLYPEILLEPFLKKYGSQEFVSGVMKIATARGNKELSSGFVDYSNNVLYGGPIMDFDCRENLLTSKVLPSGRPWGDDFHVYSLRWAPDRITLSYDGEEWARVEPAASGLAQRFPDVCSHLPRKLLALGSKMAPFDDHFFLTFGVAAGSITEFPTGASTTDGHPKPWSNTSPKARLNFWNDMDSWMQTWTQPELLVDYVKVVAL